MCSEVKERKKVHLPAKLILNHTNSVGYNNICNCVFGMSKNHPFLKFSLETLKLNYDEDPDYSKRWVPEKTGPIFLTAMLVSMNIKYDACKDGKLLTWVSITSPQILFDDPSILMIPQHYLCLQSDENIMRQVTTTKYSKNYFYLLFRRLMEPGKGKKKEEKEEEEKSILSKIS